MINAAANVPAISGEFAELVSEHLDELITYAAHLVGDADSAVEMAAAGIFHAAKYPPARVRVDGTAALYRAVTRACRTGSASRRGPAGRRGSGVAAGRPSRRNSAAAMSPAG